MEREIGQARETFERSKSTLHIAGVFIFGFLIGVLMCLLVFLYFISKRDKTKNAYRFHETSAKEYTGVTGAFVLMYEDR